MAVTFSKETEKAAVDALREFCETELEWELGNLQAGQLLTFFLRELAPSVYNQAISDADRYLHERMTDLPAVCYEPEFPLAAAKKRSARKE